MGPSQCRRLCGHTTSQISAPLCSLAFCDVFAAMMANVMQGAGKATAKRSSRKVLADKTNATPVAGLIPNESPRKAPIVAVAPQSKAEEETVSPHLKLRSLEPQPATPVVVRGEDLLRSLVHSNLSITETPNGLAKQSPEAETPQFGVPPVSPYQATAQELQGASADLEVSAAPYLFSLFLHMIHRRVTVIDISELALYPGYLSVPHHQASWVCGAGRGCGCQATD